MYPFLVGTVNDRGPLFIANRFPNGKMSMSVCIYKKGTSHLMQSHYSLNLFSIKTFRHSHYSIFKCFCGSKIKRVLNHLVIYLHLSRDSNKTFDFIRLHCIQGKLEMNTIHEHGTPTVSGIKCQSVPSIVFMLRTSYSDNIYFCIK